jgi:hypothetical protein
MWFHNQARPTSKPPKSDLRLNQTDKRKLAPAQAYCNYAGKSGLKEIVEARWNQHIKSNPAALDGGSAEDFASGDKIPLTFMLKIAKEVYDALSPEERKIVDDRREEDRQKLYRSIQDIDDVGERDAKLTKHET